MINKKWFLYITEFFSGMSVMAVELGASRLLAPYFSSSQIVWTIIIGTIMIAMALGNVIGGRLADKKPSPDRLYFLLVIAAVWIVAIPFFGKYVIAAISFIFATFVSNSFLIWASFTSCMLIFVFPLLLLGMVTPSLVKFAVSNLDNNGKTVGELGALNTIGSIIGTFLPTFVTIPTVGTAMTFIIFAAILFIIGLVYFIYAKKKLVKVAICGVLGIVFGILGMSSGFAFFQENLYEGESIYNYLKVEEDEDSISLSTNILFGVQSIKMKGDTLTGMYYDYAMAAPVMANTYNKDKLDLLVLGLGTGTYPSQCLKYFSNVKATGVEIDSKIVDLATEYFDMPSEVEAVVFDGRAYLKTSGMYDVIMVDAYQDITIPFQMSTVEFFEMVKEHLNEDGVMVVNLNMFSSKDGSINDYLCDTICKVFPNVYMVKTSSSNREVFATKNANLKEILGQELSKCSQDDLKKVLQKVNDNLETITLDLDNPNILTDDKAPVELLGMGVLDEMISSNLAYYRSVFKGKSFSQIISYLLS